MLERDSDSEWFSTSTCFTTEPAQACSHGCCTPLPSDPKLTKGSINWHYSPFTVCSLIDKEQSVEPRNLLRELQTWLIHFVTYCMTNQNRIENIKGIIISGAQSRKWMVKYQRTKNTLIIQHMSLYSKTYCSCKKRYRKSISQVIPASFTPTGAP